MPYALQAPCGNYFVNPSYSGWDFTKDPNEATTFPDEASANAKKLEIDRAVGATYWDYMDIIPFPKVVVV